MSNSPPLSWVDRWLGSRDQSDPERRFHAELALVFAAFQITAVLLLGSIEFLWGTPAIGVIFFASAVVMLPIITALRWGSDPSHVSTALLIVLFATAFSINVSTGGRALGANVALPTLTLFAVLMSTTRMAAVWVVLILLQVFLVAQMRRSGATFPISPSPQWVESAIDRVPVVFSLAAAIIGLMISRALKRFRTQLEAARSAEKAAKDSERAFATRATEFARIAADGFWETDAKLELTYLSPGLAKLLGVGDDAMLGHTPEAAYRKRFPDARFEKDYMQPLRDRETYVDQLLSAPDPNGGLYWFRSEGHPHYDSSGQFVGYRGAVHDVTAEHVARKALSESEKRLRLITDNLPALISYIDSGMVFRFNNNAYARWLKRPLAEITGKPLADVFTAETFSMIEPSLRQALGGKQVEFELPPGGLRDRHAHVTYVPDIDQHGRVRGAYGLILDVTEARQAEAENIRHAETDALTGLANRRRLMSKIDEAIARAERSESTMALLFLDLDNFKPVNDTHGHEAGDRVLQEFSRRLESSVRQTDSVARLAGDEFVIILEALHSPVEAELVATKIIAAMGDPISLVDEELRLSTSIGIAIRRAQETDGALLLKRADAALYAAKSSSKGSFQFASEP